jgi:hypothetical protein
MARRQRDYKAEYAKRIANAKAKAERDGRAFDRSKARGHKSVKHERAKRLRAYTPKTERGKLYRLARAAGIPDDEVDDAIAAGYPLDGLIDLVKEKLAATEAYELRGDTRPGSQLWKSRDEYLGDWWYYYHGFFGA